MKKGGLNRFFNLLRWFSKIIELTVIIKDGGIAEVIHIFHSIIHKPKSLQSLNSCNIFQNMENLQSKDFVSANKLFGLHKVIDAEICANFLAQNGKEKQGKLEK